MDGNLILEVHLVKLVNAAHALEANMIRLSVNFKKNTPPKRQAPHVICQHQSSGLDDELVGLLVAHHSCCQTRGAAGLAAGVHRPGAELLHMPEEKHTQS